MQGMADWTGVLDGNICLSVFFTAITCLGSRYALIAVTRAR